MSYIHQHARTMHALNPVIVHMVSYHNASCDASIMQHATGNSNPYLPKDLVPFKINSNINIERTKINKNKMNKGELKWQKKRKCLELKPENGY